MQLDPEVLKDIDWWNATGADLGKVQIIIEDLAKPCTTDYESKPWDIATANIRRNLFGSFPIAMQIVTTDPVTRGKKIVQKHRTVTISYDPQFPPIPKQTNANNAPEALNADDIGNANNAPRRRNKRGV